MRRWKQQKNTHTGSKVLAKQDLKRSKTNSYNFPNNFSLSQKDKKAKDFPGQQHVLVDIALTLHGVLISLWYA